MAATMQRLDEYRTYNQQFCQRVLDFLSVMITYQVCVLPLNSRSLTCIEQADLIFKNDSKKKKTDSLVIAPHDPLEEHLGAYSGLIRYMKEMDETRYGKLCGVSTFYCMSNSDLRG
jgi:hypothetical protein